MSEDKIGNIFQFVSKDNPCAISEISKIIYNLLQRPIIEEKRELIFICVGTDEFISDSFAPLVGLKLDESSFKSYHVYGTLFELVDAQNLKSTINQILSDFTNPFIVAIDSCSGPEELCNQICIVNGPLKPGSVGFNKLPSIGDISIMGMVFLPAYLQMESKFVHLSDVYSMAEIISKSIILSTEELFQEKDKPLK